MDTRNDPTRELFPRGAVRLLYIRKSRVGSDWNEVPHTHACSEMFYCIRGQGRINIGGKLHKVEPDDLVLINPPGPACPGGGSGLSAGVCGAGHGRAGISV